MNQDTQPGMAVASTTPEPSLLPVTPTVVPVVQKRSALAVWTLVVNLVYYGAPCLFLGVLALFLALTHQTSGDSLSAAIVFILIIILFWIFTSTLGLAMVVLDIIYLVKIRPAGVKKGLTIASLCLFGLSTIVAPLLISILQHHM